MPLTHIQFEEMHQNVSEQNQILDELDKHAGNVPKSMHRDIKRCFLHLEGTWKYDAIPLPVGSTNQQTEFSCEEALFSPSATSVQ